jgi:hypothetical protein
MSLWCFRFRLKLLTFNLRAPLLNSPASFANSLMNILHACWLVEGEGSKGHYVPQTSSNFFTFGNVSSKRCSVEPQKPCSRKHRISDAFDTFTLSCLEITAVRLGVWQATNRRYIGSHWIQSQNWHYVFKMSLVSSSYYVRLQNNIDWNANMTLLKHCAFVTRDMFSWLTGTVKRSHCFFLCHVFCSHSDRHRQ